MVSFDDFKATDGSPLYVQILRHIRHGIAAGTILDGDALPSRRVLSATLGINPNTVQRAYRELEEDGLVSSHSGAKSCMVLPAAAVERVRRELVESEIKTMARTLRAAGVSKDEAKELLERFWEEDEEA
ncbi:MAG: GntR family transcriptional regulator [Synergistaceae bacterium]|nr:GntR family transcriptional regulator [Synergistaceae bacterium]